MATPPQGRKMAPERPFPILIETGKSYSKTGLLPAVFGGFPAVFPAVFQRFSSGFANSLPAVFRRSPGRSTAVFRQFCQWSPGSFPAVCRWFDRGFAGGSTAVSWWFPGGLAGGFTDGSTATRSPWINPGPAPAYPFIRKKLSGNSVHTFKPTNPAWEEESFRRYMESREEALPAGTQRPWWKFWGTG